MIQKINIGIDTYQVLHTVPIHLMNDEQSAKFREDRGFETVIKNEQAYFFCSRIEEATVLEEVNYNAQNNT